MNNKWALAEGLSVEDFFSGRSMPRNRELIRVFRELEFVEHLGSGMNRILRAYDKSIFHLSENFVEIVFPYEEDYLRLTEPVTEQVAPEVTPEVEKLISYQG
jgi:ATP-dependent DNA helicase RecG